MNSTFPRFPNITPIWERSWQITKNSFPVIWYWLLLFALTITCRPLFILVSQKILLAFTFKYLPYILGNLLFECALVYIGTIIALQIDTLLKNINPLTNKQLLILASKKFIKLMPFNLCILIYLALSLYQTIAGFAELLSVAKQFSPLLPTVVLLCFGIYFTPSVFLILGATVLEDHSLLGAIKRGFRLSFGNWWRIMIMLQIGYFIASNIKVLLVIPTLIFMNSSYISTLYAIAYAMSYSILSAYFFPFFIMFFYHVATRYEAKQQSSH